METKSAVELVLDPLVGATRRFAVQLPTVLAGFLLLLAGMFLARVLRTLTERLCDRAGLDSMTSRVGINEVLARLGLGKSPAYAAAFVVYWFILFLFIVAAANAVSMTIVSELLERFVAFLPSLVAALLILFAGLLFARFLSQVVANAAAANAVRGGELAAGATHVVVVAFTGMSALEQLGLRAALVATAAQIVLASAGLAAALAFGLGGRDAAAGLIRDFLDRRKS